MGLDLWFREDVARILASMHETMRATTYALQEAGAKPAHGAEVADAYRQGFVDALRAVAVAFGVCSPGARRAPDRAREIVGFPSHALPASGEWPPWPVDEDNVDDGWPAWSGSADNAPRRGGGEGWR